MNEPFAELPGFLFVAGKAEDIHSVLQKVFIPGNMWIVAGAAFVLGNRLVGILFIEKLLFMALEAGIRSLSGHRQE